MDIELIVHRKMVTEEERIDLGLSLNAETELGWFKPGELMQLSYRIAGLKVWVAHYCNEWWDEYRVAFGEVPISLQDCDSMDAQSAVLRVFEEVRKHVQFTG